MAKPAARLTARRVPTPRAAIARAAKRVRARRIANPPAPAGASSPGAVMAFLEPVGVGAVSYAGTRFVQRMAWTVTAKKKPRWAKHVHALAGVLTFAAVAFAGRRIRSFDRFYEPALIGTGTAAVQGLVSAYVPKFAWLTADPRASDLPGGTMQEATLAAGDDGDYLEQQLQKYERPRRQRSAAQGIETAAAASGEVGIDQNLMAELGTENLDDLYNGVFEDPTLS